MANAAETIKKAGKDGRQHVDEKYVRTACGTAYNGVLKALDGYLILKGVERRKGRKSIEWYETNVAKMDRKLNSELKDVYEILHLSGYYDGMKNVKAIEAGFDAADAIIERIKP